MPRSNLPNHDREMPLKRGVFTISLDFELIWGELDRYGPEKYRRECEIVRNEIIDEMLNLFVEFDFPGTWCILGHLFQDRCEGKTEHLEILNSRSDQADWFDFEPSEIEHSESIFLGKSLVLKIKDCPVKQEIGSHSFSHLIFDDTELTREAVRLELEKCVELADKEGIKLNSFVFPRNSVGHLDLVKESGFVSFRGVEPHWYEEANVPTLLTRAMRMIDILRGACPPTVLPKMTDVGLWNIPGSALYFPMHGFRKYLPLSVRTNRLIKGLQEAANHNRIFHLWFHPINMAINSGAMFKGLREVLEFAASLRSEGKMDFLSMQDILDQNR